ncbi:class I adenylate-forming enzyme family protein [Cellulomonas sp. S1-8]|uniref:class I adenylate-forming enzyme family protein n=1 Tax=Cellulomonas sp. S1-8 TaxID=2904790 RepID=UPI00224407BC|nr:AMP-binding protein [Cellulomonas sp. S1-8]UZN03400.1 AMP-binding protein [Cellulomonas sp. S1-8]
MDICSRLDVLAAQRPGAVTLRVLGDATVDDLTRGELADATREAARSVAADGDGRRTVVILPTGNDGDSVARLLGCLRAGAVPLVIPPRLPPADLLPSLAAEVGADVRVLLHPRLDVAATVVPGVVGQRTTATDLPAYYLCTSGTTGTPKLAPQGRHPRHSSQLVPNALLRATGWVAGQRQLLSTPFYHAGPLVALLDGLMDGNLIVTTRTGDGADAVAAVLDEGIMWWQTTPPQMAAALAAVPSVGALRTLRSLFHGVFPCDHDLKREWIAGLGADRVHEWYGSTEGYGYTFVRGDDWLARPGTVGRGLLTRLEILDREDRRVPVGAVGRVHMRRLGLSPGGARTGVRGFRPVGDLGHLDADGFLFLHGRDDGR